MTEPLKIGIAGYGVVGKRRHQFINLHPALEVVAVCDRTFAEKGEPEGTMADGTRHYATYQRLLEVERLDALFVCLSNDVAAEATVAGLQLGLHVFCEKPPGRDLDDIAAVIREEKKHPDLKLKYGFNHRYHDSVRDALEIIEAGRFGKVINMRGVYGKSRFISYGAHSDWRVTRELSGGGILLDQGIHMVDLMRLFAGEFAEVKSFVSNEFWGHDIEDNAYALMRTGDGCVAMLHSTATQWRHRFNLEIMMENGGLILSGILSGSKSYGAETLTVLYPAEDDQGDPRETMTRYNNDPSWADEVAEFANAVLDDKPILNGSSDDALRTMHLVYRIYCADPEWRAKWGLDDSIPLLV